MTTHVANFGPILRLDRVAEEQARHNRCFLMGSLRTVCFQLGFLKGNLGARVSGTYHRESRPGGPFG